MFHVALIKVPVTDIDRSARFYGRLLDAEPSIVAPEFGWAHFETESLTLALYVADHAEDQRPPGGSVDFHLVTEDLAGLEARMADLVPGVAIRAHDDGSVSFDIADPDGNRLRILGPSVRA